MSTQKSRTGVNPGTGLDPLPIYIGLVSTYLSSSDHPDASRLSGHLRARQFGKLLDWSERPSPQLYESPAHYLADVQLAALVKKYPFSAEQVPGIDPEAAAVRTFLASEHRCKRVNQHRRAKRKRFDKDAQFWADSRRFITKVLGPRPDIKAIMNKCDFTAGASVGVHGNSTNLQRKLFAESWSVTPSALPYAMTALWLNIHARDCILPGAIKCYDPEKFREIVNHKVEYTSCNNISFVPKTAKTARTIAVEPLLNGYVQKGIDEEMRGLLRRVNIDLGNQTPNQMLAYAGSLGGFNPYCTIDLSAASDSLATEVVRDLLPPEWFELLSSVRSPRYTLHGADYHYEKFCSMGNGFCFPLQSLIFASVCYAALQEVGENVRSFSVYGDDIIVPQNVALLVIERLRDLGFKTNRDKTFVTGPFRESCGRDWFHGQDVRPVNLTKPLDSINRLCAFHNSTLRSPFVANLFTEVRGYLRTFQPKLLRPGVEPGDTAFSVSLDCAMTSPWVWWCRERQAWAWREILSLPVSDKMPLTVEQHANAVSYAVLRGASSAQPFTVRYSSRLRKSVISRPFWTKLKTPFGYGWSVVLDQSVREDTRTTIVT